MLMGHPPQIITWSRETAPQGRFEGLMPVPVSMVVEELVASDAEEQEALADPREAVQKMAQAGPQACHRVAVHTRAVRGTPRRLAGAMVDRPMVIVDLGEMIEAVFIREELRPAFHLGGDDGLDRRGASMLEHFQRDWRGWCVRVCLVAALHQAPAGWTQGKRI